MQQDYLKRYLCESRTRPKKTKKSRRLLVLDDNECFLKRGVDSEDDLLLSGEDAPQIVNASDKEFKFASSQTNCNIKWISIGEHKKLETPIRVMPAFELRQDNMQKATCSRAIKTKTESEKFAAPDLSPPRKKFHTENLKNSGKKNIHLGYGEIATLNKSSDISEYNSNKRKVELNHTRQCIENDELYIKPVVHETINKFYDGAGNLLKKKQELDITKSQYRQWGMGLRQVENYKRNNFLHNYECSKPLARYSNDKDLENFLKGRDRHGDPMVTYLNKKKGKSIDTTVYRGFIPENRYNISPGYRWDGVDRSNGYEKKYFDQQSQNKVNIIDTYTILAEDM